MATQIGEDPPPISPSSKPIFISYSSADRGWVHDYLKRLLAAAELDYVVDDESFDYGDNLPATIKNFIAESHYTLFVMTPAWVHGKWTDYEKQLAEERDRDLNERRILPIKLKDCQLPSSVGDLLYLDLCDIDQRDERIIELLQQLGVSDSAITKAKSSIAKKTLQLLIELMDEPAVRKQVLNLREHFERVEERIGILVSHKTLHDNFQNVQQNAKLVKRSIKKLLSDTDLLREARTELSALRRNLHSLLAYAAKVKLDQGELAFVIPLRILAEDLSEAAKSSDAASLANVVLAISNEIDFWLPAIDSRMVNIVKDRPLQTLVECLQAVYERIVNFDFDETATELLREYKAAIESLVEFETEILRMIADHTWLQRSEVELHKMCSSGDPTLHQISDSWRYIELPIRQLKLAGCYETLFELRDELNALLSNRTCVRDDRFAQSVGSLFSEFVEEAGFAFNTLDVDLLTRCENFAGIDFKKKLRETIRRMQNREAYI